MDQKSTETLNMDLPPYSPTQKTTKARKPWIHLTVIFALLIVIIVAATLFGVYMTQKHTEEMVTMAFNSQNGETVKQTVSYNEKDNIALISISNTNVSTAVLYDYNRNLIGFRQSNKDKCFVMKMDNGTLPLSTVIDSVKHFQTHNSPAPGYITYSLKESKEANLMELGMMMNMFCGDVPVYWAEMVNPNHRKETIVIAVGIKVNGVSCSIIIRICI